MVLIFNCVKLLYREVKEILLYQVFTRQILYKQNWSREPAVK